MSSKQYTHFLSLIFLFLLPETKVINNDTKYPIKQRGESMRQVSAQSDQF